MRTKVIMVTLGFLGALLMSTGSAAARIEGGWNEIHLCAGEGFGKDSLDQHISGQRPLLDHDALFGLGVSVADNPNRVAKVGGLDLGFEVLTADVKPVWSFLPDSKFMGYLDDGLASHAGVGARIFSTKTFEIRFGGAYRSMDKLADELDDSPITIEAAGRGRVF